MGRFCERGGRFGLVRIAGCAKIDLWVKKAVKGAGTLLGGSSKAPESPNPFAGAGLVIIFNLAPLAPSCQGAFAVEAFFGR